MAEERKVNRAKEIVNHSGENGKGRKVENLGRGRSKVKFHLLNQMERSTQQKGGTKGQSEPREDNNLLRTKSKGNNECVSSNKTTISNELRSKASVEDPEEFRKIGVSWKGGKQKSSGMEKVIGKRRDLGKVRIVLLFDEDNVARRS